MGRPSDYSEELAEEICDLLSEGMSLVEVCNLEGMPNRRTVLRWMEKYPEFATSIARVREGPQSDWLVDDIARVERRVETGELPPDAARVLIHSKQWRAAKLAPKKYGDKTLVETNATVKVEHTRKLDISTLTDDQLDALEGALRQTVAQLEKPMKVIEHDE